MTALVRPASLRLDFSRRQYIGAVPLTRATEATYVDRNGAVRTAKPNTPRLSFDPTTGECIGALFEPSRTNRILQGLDISLGTLTRVDASGDSWAFDNATPATVLTPTTANNTHFVHQDATGITAGHVIAASLLLRPLGYSKAKIRIGTTTFSSEFYVIVDLAAGTISDPVLIGSASQAFKRMEFYRKGGAWRVFLTGKVDGAATTVRMQINILDANGNESFAGDGVSGISTVAWDLASGANGMRPSSFIPTAGSQVTRNSDNNILDGFNGNMSWVNISLDDDTLGDSTIVLRARAQAPMDVASNNWFFSLTNGGTSDRVLFRQSNGTTNLLMTTASATVVNINDFTPLVDTDFVAAIRLKKDDVALITNVNRTIQKDSSCAMPVGISAFSLGSDRGTSTFINGPISEFTYYPFAANDYELKKMAMVE